MCDQIKDRNRGADMCDQIKDRDRGAEYVRPNEKIATEVRYGMCDRIKRSQQRCGICATTYISATKINN